MKLQTKSKFWGIWLRIELTLLGLFVLLGIVVLLTQTQSARATSADLSLAVSNYPNIQNSQLNSCSLCHTSAIPALNPYGTDYLNHGRNQAALGLIESLDSDGDGYSNIVEIQALSFPGDPKSIPATPTSTSTRVPPSATPTATKIPPSSTPTATNLPPSATPTKTSAPPSSTPRPSATPQPSATPTLASGLPSETPVPASPTPTGIVSANQGVDLDIWKFPVPEEESLDPAQPLQIRLLVMNSNKSAGQGTLTVTGVQNSLEVYNQSLTVSFPGKSRQYVLFPSFTPTSEGEIIWTATMVDGVQDRGDVVHATTDIKNESGDPGKGHSGSPGGENDH